MSTKKTTDNFSALMEIAQKKEKETKTTESTSIINPAKKDIQEENVTHTHMEEPSAVQLSEKISLDAVFSPSNDKNLEVIRIPASTHRTIKLLAFASGKSITTIATNILNLYLTDNEKVINNYIKKNL
jgi:hypothetical protein